MAKKVTDPDLLAELNQSIGPVSDPDLLKELETEDPEEKERVLSKALNVPAAMLTGDPETDRRMAEIAWDRGFQRQLTGADIAKFSLLTAGMGLAPLSGPLPAAASAGLMGAGLEPSDEPLDVALAGAESAALGYGVARALPLAAQGLEAAGKQASRLSGPVLRKAVDYGRKAITGVSSPLARRKELPEDVVMQALESGAIKPGSTVRGVAERLQTSAEPLSEEYASILSGLERRGVHGPDAEALARTFLAESQAAAQESALGQAASPHGHGASWLRGGGPRAEALSEVGESISSRALPVSGRGRLGLMQAENMKRQLQQRAATEFVKEGPTSLTGAARKETAGRMREAIENAVKEQSSLAPDLASEFEPVKGRLHRTLSALGPAREAAARETRRSPFGLHEALGLASGISSGNPAAAIAAPALMSGLRNRLASTMASGAYKAGKGLQSLGEPIQLSGDEAQLLVQYLRSRFPREFAMAVAEDEQGQ